MMSSKIDTCTKAAAAAIAAFSCNAPALAQRPSIPPQTIVGPALGYRLAETALDLPAGLELDQVASAAFDSAGHLYVLHRGAEPFLEFDGRGRFVRAFGAGLLERAHSLTIDPAGNFWVTDVSAHVVMKLDADAHVLLTLGTPGAAGVWDEASGSRSFDEPTDVAIGPNGEIFVTQGHSRGDPRVLKFDRDGRFLKSWGGRGTLPWEFAVAHSIVIDSAGLVYVADRENRRIEVFDLDGEFVKGWVFKGMACSLDLAADGRLYMTTGFDAQIVGLDRDGRLIGVMGRPGDAPGEFGEAHDIVVGPEGAIYVSDVVNRRLTKYLPR